MHPSPNGASHENGQRPTPIVIQTQPEADTKDGVRVKRRMSLTQDGRDAVANTETEANHSAMAFGDGISCTTWALHPQSVVRYYWDCFILLLMVYTCIVLPLSIAEFDFMEGMAWDVLEQLINVIFLVDLIINMHTGYVDEQTRTLIMDARLTRVHYAKSWLLPDLLATVPAEFIVRQSLGPAGVATLNTGQRFLIRCLRLLRVLRLMRLRRILQRLEIKSGLQTSTKTAIKFCAVVFLCSHWYCCAWFLLGSTLATNKPGSATLGSASTTNISSAEKDFSNTWLQQHDLYLETSVDQYVAALYWSLSTMSTIAYGDITPMSSVERIFSCFVMVTGTSVYAYGVASVVTLATGANETERHFMKRKDELNRYMRQMHMPVELKHSLREYFMHFQAAIGTFNERSLLCQLSPHLQARVTNLANAGLIRQVPFFQGQEDRCITAVMLALTPNLFVPDEMICYMGETGTDVYILKSGEVMVFVPRLDGQGVKEIARLRKGNFFGEMAIVNGDGARRNANVKSVAYSIIYSMSNRDLKPVMERFVSLKAAIETVAAKREAEIAAAQKAPTAATLPRTESRNACTAINGGCAPVSPVTAGARTSQLGLDGQERYARMEQKMSRLEESMGRMAAAMEQQQKSSATLIATMTTMKEMMMAGGAKKS